MTVMSLSKSAGSVSHAGQDAGVWVVTNEIGRKEVQTLLAAEKLRGNAVYGCSGTEVLNLASVCDGIEHISVFDKCPNVQKLWEKLPKIILSLSPDKLKESQVRFCSWTKTEYSPQENAVATYILEGTSFLSTSERLTRIIKIFQAHKPTAPKVTFTLCDAGNPREFLAFNLAQQKLGAKAHAYYISNIPSCDEGAFSSSALSKKGMEAVERYEGFVRSMNLIPKQAIVIDAVCLPDASTFQQRIHIDKREDLVASYQFLYTASCLLDHYHTVRHSISKGADTTKKDDAGFTDLATAAANGRLQTLMALLDSGIHPDTPNRDGITALHVAALAGQADAIELLASRGANIHATNSGKMTPLHQAVGKGHLEAVRTLVAIGADRGKKEAHGLTPLAVTRVEGTPVYQMSSTPAYQEIQTLLKKGCAKRNPKEFTAPAAPQTSAPSSTATLEGKKSEEKGDKKKQS